MHIEGVHEVVPQRVIDTRGFSSRTWSVEGFEQARLPLQFVEDNHYYCTMEGVFRGLHYQLPPYAQDKLVRVVRGAALVIAVDIRRGSPNLGEWVSLEVSARRWNQMLIQKGFACGMLSLEAETEIICKTSNPYSFEHERTIRFDDPDIALELPVASHSLILSDKDRMAKRLRMAELFEPKWA